MQFNWSTSIVNLLPLLWNDAKLSMLEVLLTHFTGTITAAPSFHLLLPENYFGEKVLWEEKDVLLFMYVFFFSWSHISVMLQQKKWLSLMYKVQRVVLYAARCIFLPTFNLNFPSHDLKLLHSSCHLTLTRGVWFYHLTTRKANHKPLLSAWPPLHHTQQALLSPEVLCPNSPSW